MTPQAKDLFCGPICFRPHMQLLSNFWVIPKSAFCLAHPIAQDFFTSISRNPLNSIPGPNAHLAIHISNEQKSGNMQINKQIKGDFGTF